jgi:hypothetical protein
MIVIHDQVGLHRGSTEPRGVTVCEHLRVLVDGQKVRIDSLMQAQIKINERLHAVERLVSTYQEPRG